MKEFENGFTPQNVDLIHKAIDKVLKELGNGFGISLQTGSLRYDKGQFTTKITGNALNTITKPVITDPQLLIGKTYRRMTGSSIYRIESYRNGNFTVRTKRDKGYLITPEQITQMIEI